MAIGTSLMRMIELMADMEMIYPDGLKRTFTDKGVELDLVPLSECCEMCNDPRMINIDGIKTCIVCNNINHIDLNKHAEI
jgi:hypothetical protein